MKSNVTVISNMYPSNEYKSFGIFVENQVQSLREKGLNVDVIAVDNPKKGKLNLLKKYGKWFFTFFFHLILKGRNTSVVHAHYVFPSGWLAKWYKKFFHSRFIITAHGGDIDKMARKSRRIFTITKSILEDADHVIAVGQKLYEILEKDFGIPSNKLSLINMGVNLSIFQAIDKDQAREICGINKNKIPLLFVGNIIEQKGLHDLVEAFSMLKETNSQLELYLIGSNKDQSYSLQLNEFISKKGLKEVIHFLGTKSQKEVATWMAAAEVFILPSHIEGFGLVALEAMACGTPVVGTNVGGLSCLLSDGNGVLTQVENPTSLTIGIQSILESESLKKKLIQKGLKCAFENEQKIMTERVIEIYKCKDITTSM